MEVRRMNQGGTTCHLLIAGHAREDIAQTSITCVILMEIVVSLSDFQVLVVKCYALI